LQTSKSNKRSTQNKSITTDTRHGDRGKFEKKWQRMIALTGKGKHRDKNFSIIFHFYRTPLMQTHLSFPKFEKTF